MSGTGFDCFTSDQTRCLAVTSFTFNIHIIP